MPDKIKHLECPAIRRHLTVLPPADRPKIIDAMRAPFDGRHESEREE